MSLCNQAVEPPKRVLNSILCENNCGLADNRLREDCLVESRVGETKKLRQRKRNIKTLRLKRLKRNKKKKDVIRKETRKERSSRITRRLSTELHDFSRRENTLKHQLSELQTEYRKERRLSAFCWTKFKEEELLRIQQR